VSQLDHIKKLLQEDKLEEAARELTLAIYTPEGIAAWERSLKDKDPAEKIPQLLAYASKIVFSHEIETAVVIFTQRTVKLGVRFFCDYIITWADLVFILLHERNHLLISFFYGSMMRDFTSFDFGNTWEDIYINNTILKDVSSNLCQRYYSRSEENDIDWLCSQMKIPEWFAWFCDTYPRAVAENEDFYQAAPKLQFPYELQKLGYYAWMNIGLVVERTLQFDNPPMDIGKCPPEEAEQRAASGGIRSGDNDEMPETINQEVVKTRVGGKKLPDHIKKLLSLQLNSDDFVPKDTLDLRKYHDIITNEIVNPLLKSRIGDDSYKILTVFPSAMSRKDVLSISLGQIPPYWEQIQQRPVKDKAVSLYMDTSQSMEKWYPLIPQIVKELNGFCFPVYNFDTEVYQVEDPLENAIYTTTKQTNYNSVVKHMLWNNTRNAIVFSDSSAPVMPKLITAAATLMQQFIYVTVEPDIEEVCGFTKLVKAMKNKAKIVRL
jgi:hypothetical protein